MPVLFRNHRSGRRRGSIPVIVCFSVLLASAIPSLAVSAGPSSLIDEANSGVYSATGLYDPEIIHYKNGLTLILKPRSGVRTVSVRVHVGIGMAHYECGQRQVPHFLEHMLYDAIPGMTEQELERRFFELGATANASTRSTDTVFKLDVYSGTALEALDVTADMLTNAEITGRAFTNAKKIIYREEGGEPGPVEEQSLLGGRLASGLRTALADVAPRHFGICGLWDTGDEVSYSSVVEAYEAQYVPENMVWAIVGDFDNEQVVKWAERRLSTLPLTPRGDIQKPSPGEFTKRVYTGFANEPQVVLAAMTDGQTGANYYAYGLIEHLLDVELYENLRLDAALAYTPDAAMYSWADWGVFAISAETETVDQQEALDAIKQLVAELTESPLDAERFRAAQLSLLRQWAQAVETNTDFAKHYINSLPQFRHDGQFVNDEARVATLTPASLQNAAARLFAPENVIYVRDGDRQARINSD